MKNRLIMVPIVLTGLLLSACPGPTDPLPSPGANDRTIDLLAIPGVVAPQTGAVPVVAPVDTAQYTGTVSWSPNHERFAADVVYTAQIALAPKPGFTLAGLAANSLGVAGAVTTHAAGSGNPSAVFPACAGTSGTAVWARTVTAGTANAYFVAVATDSQGNAFAAGCQTGNHTYGPGLEAASVATKESAVLVKYQADGSPLWVRTTANGTDHSTFKALAVDAAGNVYAAGYQIGSSAFSYGDGVSLSGVYTGGGNAILVKYDPQGKVLWARTPTVGGNASYFYGVAVDAAGNVYVAGAQSGNGSFGYGNGVSIAAGVNNLCATIVKYSSSGTALWASTVSAGNGFSEFSAIALDSHGNAFAVGYQGGYNGSNTFGPGVVLSITDGTSRRHAILLKYSSSGSAVWGKITTGTYAGDSMYRSLAVDAAGKIYALSNNESGTGTQDFGAGVSVSITSSKATSMVKMDGDGNAQWAKTINTGATASLSALSVDQAGNLYVGGSLAGPGLYSFGNGVTVNTLSAISSVLLKYHQDGQPVWARTVTSGTGNSQLDAVAVDKTGRVHAAGRQMGNTEFSYGPGIAITGPGVQIHPVIVKYQ